MNKKRKVILTIILVLAGAIVLISCNIVEPVQYRYAKKLLEEKYNEEFEVLDTWGNGGKSYYALCYPVRDRSILFEGNFALDRSDFRDEYDRAIFAKEVKEIIQPKLDSLFSECYVYISIASKESGITDKDAITIKSFIDATESPELYFVVGVNNDSNVQIDFDEEYKLLTQYIKDIDYIDDSAAMHLYFLPEQQYLKYVNYYKNNVGQKGEIKSIVKGYPDIGFGIENGILNKSKEEYINFRKEQ